jgi:hypothetical protein
MSSFEGAGGWKFSKVDGEQRWEGRPVSSVWANQIRFPSLLRAARRLIDAERRRGRRGEGSGPRCEVLALVFWRRWAVISFGLARFENRRSRCQPVEVPTSQRRPVCASISLELGPGAWVRALRTDWNSSDITMLES